VYNFKFRIAHVTIPSPFLNQFAHGKMVSIDPAVAFELKTSNYQWKQMPS